MAEVLTVHLSGSGGYRHRQVEAGYSRRTPRRAGCGRKHNTGRRVAEGLPCWSGLLSEECTSTYTSASRKSTGRKAQDAERGGARGCALIERRGMDICVALR